MTNHASLFNTLPADGFVRQSQLIPAVLPFSPATLWRRVKDGTFPSPLKLSVRVTAWRVEDIRSWIRALDDDAEVTK